MPETIRWGILGTGSIAHKFARGLECLEDAELAAVGSRAQETADEFADEFGAPRRHDSYAGLADDPEVDVVYVATPHTLHRDNTLLCLRAGKAVLCEKPLAANAAQAEDMVSAAREEGIFLMEAMWTRFIPAVVRLRELLAEGAVGDLRMLKADFCFRTSWNPEGRLLNPELAGGALLDVGCYTVSLASMVCGRKPLAVASLAEIGKTGVDEQSAILLRYAGGRLAVLTCAVRTSTPHEAHFYGTEGRIKVHHPFWHAQELTVCGRDGEEEVLEIPYEGNGYNYEAAEVMECLRQGRTESEIMPLDDSLAVMRTLDWIRAQWGLSYPFE